MWTVTDDNVYIGKDAGVAQTKDCIAIGTNSGNTQTRESIALGHSAGNVQGNRSIAIGAEAGGNQGPYAVSVGQQSGNTDQSRFCVAVGAEAGKISQGEFSIGVGSVAGAENQGSLSTCVGWSAGRTNAGYASTCIGAGAGFHNQPANAIFINASGQQFSSASPHSFSVTPVRNLAGTHPLSYNPTNYEITYASSSRNYKQNIKAYDATPAAIESLVMALKAHTFQYKESQVHKDENNVTRVNQPTMLGLMAEDTHTVDPLLSTTDFDSAPVNVDWNAITCLLLEHVKVLTEKVNALTKKLQ